MLQEGGGDGRWYFCLRAASPLPSRGPKGGRKCYITPAFLGVPNKGTKSNHQKYKKNKKNYS